MSRIINMDGVGKQRKRLTREVVLALRKLTEQGEVTDETRDLAAFIAIQLEAVHKTIELTVTPWEKRDYWVKADKFRLAWSWSGIYAEEMRSAVIADDWGQVAIISAKIAEKLQSVEVPRRHRLGEPWHGAYQNLTKSQNA